MEFQFSSSNSEKDLAKSVHNKFRKRFFTDTKGPAAYSTYKGAELKSEYFYHPLFRKICVYIDNLFDAIDPFSEEGLKGQPDIIRKELIRYNEQGCLCVYLSVVLYSLLHRTGIAKETSMRLVQGYYLHEARQDNPFAMAMGSIHAGLHSWIVIDQAVVDLSIGQERHYFDFDGQAFIIGTVPEGMHLHGFAEPKKIVNNYVKRFAKFVGMTEDEWISFHLKGME